ncbi:MAG: DNA primase [Planctomycetes bacterium]|nr:DNA primase [Planctomycetota bacterium]MCP4772510.1 DNA primase [Planctomycetota bacterium]MCP4860919.1 DNA primase [Planctomycetota bacterium]
MSDLQNFIDDLKERLPIESVVAQKVQLTRKGNRFWGLCPFHAEKTPSFTVHPTRNAFKCFGCGVGGDAITFVRETEGLEFFEALRVLADQAGLQLPGKFSGGSKEQRGEREQAREALLQARAFFQDCLSRPDAADARKYLLDRSIPEDSWKKFHVGWAPRNRQAMISALRDKGVTDHGMLAAGLVLEDESHGILKSRFWERLMFPVADAGDRAVGFGGRFLPGSFAEEKQMGKYINSPEGPIFPKRRLLYGLEKLQTGLRNQPEAPVILCEGYLDVIQLHRAGYQTAVAALGTAITEEHARRLARSERPVILMLDPDEAGRRAAARAGRLMIMEGIDVRIARLPDGQDPADMVASGRTEELSGRVADSWDILRWRLDTWSRKADFTVPAVLHKAAMEMAEWIASTPSPVVAEAWGNQVRAALGVSENALRRLIHPDSGHEGASYGASGPAISPSTTSLTSPEEVLLRNEREILVAVLHDPSAYSRFRDVLDTLQLQDSVAMKILDWCRQQREEGHGFDLEQALIHFRQDEAGNWLDRVRQARPEDPCLALERALDALPGNREQALAAPTETKVEMDDLRSFLRRVNISPND